MTRIRTGLVAVTATVMALLGSAHVASADQGVPRAAIAAEQVGLSQPAVTDTWVYVGAYAEPVCNSAGALAVELKQAKDYKCTHSFLWYYDLYLLVD